MKLEFERITKSYGKKTVIDQFTYTLKPGIYALLGPNGSGKSTLMNILTDNLSPDAGTITYTDINGNLHAPKDYRERIGFMPQYPGLYPNFTVNHFLWYIATLKGMSRQEARKQITEILDEVELTDAAFSKIGTLSGGMKQRLALAQAVLGEPEILILDEPTAGLDPKQRITIRNLIAKKAIQRIVLIATHIVSDIDSIARECIFLHKGKILEAGPPEVLTKKMAGVVWLAPCAVSEIYMMQEKYAVTEISPVRNGNVMLRILSDKQPGENAEITEPCLEDRYLYWFHGEQ